MPSLQTPALFFHSIGKKQFHLFPLAEIKKKKKQCGKLERNKSERTFAVLMAYHQDTIKLTCVIWVGGGVRYMLCAHPCSDLYLMCLIFHACFCVCMCAKANHDKRSSQPCVQQNKVAGSLVCTSVCSCVCACVCAYQLFCAHQVRSDMTAFSGVLS